MSCNNVKLKDLELATFELNISMYFEVLYDSG